MASSLPTHMRAITITGFGEPSVLKMKDHPMPTLAKDEVLIQVKAFGLNHAEIHMRRGEWDEYNPVSGLECVGFIASTSPSSPFQKGDKVIALMGGMGRFRPGSYGEYVTVPVENVVKTDTTLSWADLAALPLVYACAWSCLFTVLDVKKGERLLIRGATSTIGEAAVKMAVDAGAHVTATTRREDRFAVLQSWGARSVLKEETPLAEKYLSGPGNARFDKTLNLIGNTTLLDSISLTRAGGRMLQAGWLGGLAPVADFNPMIQMESGVHFSLFHSKVLASEEFPLSAVPLQEIVRKLEKGAWDAKPVKVFAFEEGEVQKAHALMETGKVGGKVVVVHGE